MADLEERQHLCHKTVSGRAFLWIRNFHEYYTERPA